MHWRPLLLFAGLTALPAPAPAQTAYSLEFGAISAFSDATVLIGFRGAPVAAKAGADLFVATFPDALIHGFFLVLLDADVTYGARLSDDVTLYPRAGASVLAGAGGGGGGGEFGYNFGVGLLGRVSPTLGIRLDYGHHRFSDGGSTVPLSTVTVGIAWIR